MTIPTINNIQTNASSSQGDPVVGLASYTPSAGANGALIVMTAISNGGTTPQQATGVTYDGNALSLVVREYSVASGNFSGAEMWKLDNPLSLAASGAIAVNGVPDSTLVASGIAAFTLLGVKQDVADDTNTVVLTSGNTIDGDVTPTDDDSLILSGVTAREQMNFAATSPHLEDIEVDPNFGSLGIGHTDVATAALTNVEWDVTGATQRIILILAAFGPASSDALVTVTPGVGTVLVSGQAPDIRARLDKRVSPGVGTVLISGLAPTVLTQVVVGDSPGAGTLLVAGAAPTLVIRLNKTENPGAGTIHLFGMAPKTPVLAAVSPGAGVIKYLSSTPTVAKRLDDWASLPVQTDGWTRVQPQSAAWSTITPQSNTWTRIV
jgi:hypothetical protein